MTDSLLLCRPARTPANWPEPQTSSPPHRLSSRESRPGSLCKRASEQARGPRARCPRVSVRASVVLNTDLGGGAKGSPRPVEIHAWSRASWHAVEHMYMEYQPHCTYVLHTAFRSPYLAIISRWRSMLNGPCWVYRGSGAVTPAAIAGRKSSYPKAYSFPPRYSHLIPYRKQLPSAPAMLVWQKKTKLS